MGKSEENSLHRWILRENTSILGKVYSASWVWLHILGHGATLVCKCLRPDWGTQSACPGRGSLGSDKHRWACLGWQPPGIPPATAPQGNEVDTCPRQLLALSGPPTLPRGSLHLQHLQDGGALSTEDKSEQALRHTPHFWDYEARVCTPACDQVPALTFHMSDSQQIFFIIHPIGTSPQREEKSEILGQMWANTLQYL